MNYCATIACFDGPVRNFRAQTDVAGHIPYDPIALATETIDGTAYELATLEALQQAIGFDASFFATQGHRPTTLGLDAEQIERAVASGVYDHELAPVKRAALAGRGVAVDSDVLGTVRVRSQGYYRDMVGPGGGRHSLLALLHLRGRPVGALMLGRSGPNFAAKEVARLESLLGAIAVGRASFQLPWQSSPLPQPAARSLGSRAVDWVRGERQLVRKARPEGDVLVRDKAGYREMVALSANGELVWTRADTQEPRRSAWFYVDLLHLAAARARHRHRALFIGCGGAVAARQFAEVYPGIAIDLVEIDPRVVELAREWYGLDTIPNLRVHVAEGAAFLHRATPAQWDVVVVDAFDSSSLASGLESRAFFRAVSQALRPGGHMAFNAIGALRGSGPVQALGEAARAELRDVRLVPVLDPGEAFSASELRNVVILGGR